MENPFKRLDDRMNILESLLHKLIRQTGASTPNERVTRKIISEEYKLSNGTIHNAMNNGDLPYEKVGRRTLFKRSDVESWVGKR